MSAAFVTCKCQHCDGKIEFDSMQFEVSGAAGNALTGPMIPCPHCGLETLLFIPPNQRTGAVLKQSVARRSDPPKIPPPAGNPSIHKPEPPVFLIIGNVVLFLVGCGLVFQGCSGELDESMRKEGSAIRQTVYAIQYGSGFIMLALGAIMAALVRLIQKP